ncbi:MAG: BspA family leucine-rich repeat surface protein [Prevotella copri]|nr:BspA family leucine-rich repeat surface protein [Segatella copri]
MNHFINQSNGSHRGHSLMGRAMLRRFALFFPMILLMLLFLPARMVAQKAASSSKYIATFDSDTETLTFEKYEGESLPSDSESEWVEDGTSVFDMFKYDCQNIKNIVINESFKTFTPTTLSRFFGGLVKLETITGLEYLNTANVTDMSLLFNNCQKLTSLDVTHFNTAKVTNMYRMFNACGLTSLDLSNFNTAKVENMGLMFSGCSNLKTIYASDKFKTAAVTESKNMFLGCSSLSGDIDWSDKAVDKTYAKIDGGYFRDKAYDNRPWVKYADGTLTFRCGYKKILGKNEYELNSGKNRPKWETPGDQINLVVFEASFANARPTSCYAWFQNFYKLKQIEGIENLNTENVKDMSDMFSGCSGLISLDVTHFNTENVTRMSGMFSGCSGLISLDVTHFNTENVTSMSGMFDDCSGLISLDVTNFNTANVTSMSGMFYGCNKLKEIYVSDKFVTDDVISSEYMFMACSSLSGDIDWTSDKPSDKTYAKTDGGYFRDKAYDNRPWVKFADGTLTFRCGYKKTLGENEYALNSGEEKPAWYTLHDDINLVVFEASFANARPTSCYAWFQGFENLKQIEGIENLNTANVTDMSYMFKNCSNLAKLDVAHFNTAKVTTMNSMFTRCSNLAELDLTHFNTANVTNMYEMFNGCSNLVKLDVTNFNTAKVTTMFGMFNDCSNLTELDVTHFNTAKVTAMNGMFSGCSNLTELDLTHFNTENVTNMWIMFDGCSALTTIYVSDEFVITNITNKNYSLFYGCEKLKGAIKYNEVKTNYRFANYTTGYFTKLVGKNGDEKIGAAGYTLGTDNLVLEDSKDFVAYEPFKAKAASYSRKMKEGTTWATLCLPFEVSLANQNFRAFKLLSADDVAETVELEEIETSIAAGTPVIIKMKDGETKLDFTVANKEIANEVKTAETANGNYQLQGLYTQKEFSKDTDNNCYIVKGDKLMNPAKLLGETATKSVGSKPFRAYMADNSSAPAAGARMFSISVGGSTTAIEQLETTADSKAEYYDLQGRRLQDLQKGINIVKRGGKTMKVIIK